MGWPIAKFKIIRVVCIAEEIRKTRLDGQVRRGEIQVGMISSAPGTVELAIGSMKSALCIYFQNTVMGEIKTTHEFSSAPV